MWLIDSRQQQAVEHITVIQAFVLLFKFVMSETKESFAPRTIALLVGILISIGRCNIVQSHSLFPCCSLYFLLKVWECYNSIYTDYES